MNTAEILFRIKDKVNELAAAAKNGSLSDASWNMEMVEIAKISLDAMIKENAATAVFEAKPQQKIKIDDYLDSSRSGVYEVLGSESSNKIKVCRLDSEYPYRAVYFTASLGRSWNYRLVIQKKEIIEWEDLKKMKGEKVFIQVSGSDKLIEVKITGYRKNFNEEILQVFKSEERKQKFFGSLSKGKNWEAYRITEE